VREWGELVFSVRDRGPGVDAAERERIFAPFHRAPDTPPDVGGAGLGLAVASAFAAAQGGALTHAPRPGGGSVFTLRLPSSDDPDALRLLADAATPESAEPVARA
jgi:signal transduction histidine kinase